MTEVGFADRSKLLRSKHSERSSIERSRKRKLRELFDVATGDDAIPTLDPTDANALPTTPALKKFLLGADILQGLRLNELNIPVTPKHDLSSFQRVVLTVDSSDDEDAENQPPASKSPLQNGTTPSSQSATGRDGTKAYQKVKDGVAAPQSNLADSLAPSNTPSASSQKEVPSKLRARSPRPHTISPALQQGSGTSVQEDAEGGSAAKAVAESARQPAVAAQEPADKSALASSSTQEDLSLNNTDAMDVDEPPARARQDDTGLLMPNGDTNRFPDTASTPGSTAQSAATPAIHDTSTDTSPDNEGPQYVEREEEDKGEQSRSESSSETNGEAGSDNVAADTDASADSMGSAAGGVEAQLLEESASARLAHGRAPGGTKIGMEDLSKSVKPDPSSTAGRQLIPVEVQGDGVEMPSNVSRAAPSPTSNVATHPPSASGVSETRQPDVAEPMDMDSSPTKQAKKEEVQGHGRHIKPLEEVARPSQTVITPVSEHPAALDSPSVDQTTPRKRSHQPDGTAGSDMRITDSTSRTETLEEELGVPTPVSASRWKNMANKTREKRRKSIPTVVFGKPQKADEGALIQSQPKAGQLPYDDYFTPLFIEGFTRNSKWMKPVEHLLNQAHKTVSTSDQYISILDHQACRILRRVYHLQQHDKWSLRQPMRCPEPTRPPSHMDLLLQEMKWMRTDFREERKWKRAVARNLAFACAEWVASSAEERLALQVKAIIPAGPVSAAKTAEVNMTGIDSADEPLPDLIHTDSPAENDELSDPPVEFIAPSALFALQDDEVVFGLQRSQAADLLLEELPLYGAPLKVPKSDITGPEYDPDAQWKRPAVPLSKYVEGRMVIKDSPPPRKRSRYQYSLEDTDDSEGGVIFGSHHDSHGKIAPENSNVALFTAEMKPIRDRLHAGHQFRPPAEHPMPVQNFYESRIGSQWTLSEDDELKSLVREYSYNWSLISDMISMRSCFTSGAERRTPWECFERWVQLEGLPNDMAKTQYFKTYHNRIDTAQRVILQQNQIAAQQAGANGTVNPVPRKRPTTTMRVERRRNQKHLALIDAMRKLAKKRETNAQKAQQTAALAAGRKQNEAPRQAIPNNKTPKDLSLMRFERDQQLAERMQQYAQRQQEAMRQKAQALQQARQSQAGQVPATPAAAQMAQNAAQLAAANSAANAARLNTPNQLPAQGQNRPQPRLPMQAPAHAMVPQAQMATGLMPPSIPMATIPQAQLQAAMQAQQRMAMQTPQPDLNLVMQARRIQDQQRAAVQMQQAQHQVAQQQGQPMGHATPGSQGSPNGMRGLPMNGMNQQNFMANAQAMMAFSNAANGAQMATSPNAGLSMPGVAGSPRAFIQMAQPNSALANRLREFEAQIRSKNPNIPPEQAHRLASEALAKLMQREPSLHSHQQAAMSAAAGALAQGPLANGITASTSPHQYAQLLRLQQQQQAAQHQQQQAQQQVQQQQVQHQAQQQVQQQVQQQQHAQQQGQQAQAAQHQRQASGSATPLSGA
ncbi:hypothetical protein GQ53DRAFT_762427 [Thozetella sp. PMI_491]|nr:hypothetical protein GQ53DRAFT_762427 [Thozetella sp. PMI_491]